MVEVFKNRILLPLTVFLTGASVLIVEIVAVRVFAPYYGNTIFTVSGVISVILGALSLGYWIGGKLADRHPAPQWFFGSILAGGVALLISYVLGVFALPALSMVLPITLGPLISALVLFFIPTMILGTLSPYAVKLQSVSMPNQGIGNTAGSIFFWSTIGSIVGSLATSFYLIPHFGIDMILVGNALFLFLLGLIPLIMLDKRVVRTYVFVFIVPFMFMWALALMLVGHDKALALYSKDGLYEKIVIKDAVYGGRPTRFFMQDMSNSGAMYLDTNDPLDLVFDYTKYYALYQIFLPQVKHALVIGGGAYSIPKALVAELPEATVEVAEIEPSLPALGKQYFQLTDTPRLVTHIEDGRRLLQATDKTYELIYSDVYYSLFSVPAQFTTQEFFSIAKDRLADDGVFIANMIGDLSRREPSFIMTEMKTFQTVFPNSYFFAVDSPQSTATQNIIFVGYKSDKKIDMHSDAILSHKDAIIRALLEKVIDMRRYEVSPYPILTDTFSPVENLSATVVRKTFEEDTLRDGKEMLAVIDQQLRYGPRFVGAPGHTRVQEFIRAEMETLVPEVQLQEWNHTESDGTNQTLTNIIARTNPSVDRRIVLATHYDSKKVADKDSRHPTEPVPGANDSASGVAVLIEFARTLALSQPLQGIGIDFVFFDGEEGESHMMSDDTTWQPLGSTYFAEHLPDLYGNTKPEMGIVLDMVCDKDLRILKEASSVGQAPSKMAAFWGIAQGVNKDVFVDTVGNAIADDHTPLNAAGIPSILIIDFTYPSFHTTRDTSDKCSAASLQTVGQAVLKYVHFLER